MDGLSSPLASVDFDNSRGRSRSRGPRIADRLDREKKAEPSDKAG